MEIPKFETLNSSTSQERYIRLHFPDFYEHLMSSLPKDLLFGERLYWFYNHITSYPLCSCGRRTKFINCKQGYREFCSYDCMNRSKDIQLRKKKTSIEHYGVCNPMQSQEIKKKHQKTCLEKYGVDNVRKSSTIKQRIRETNLLKYGVEYPMQSQEIRNKSKSTCLEKYGVEHTSQILDVIERKRAYAQTDEFKQKVVNGVRNACLEKYGVDNIFKVPTIKEKAIHTRKQNFLRKSQDIIGYADDGNWIVQCNNTSCNKCSERCYITNQITRWNRSVNNMEQCTKLLPVAQSHNKNTSLELFVQKILDEYGIKYITNTRSIISPYELDIYVPDKNIAIECNGIFWHSDRNKEENYHKNKYLECKKHDIQLITIWEDWIMNKREIVKSIILSKLGIYSSRLYARNCTLKVLVPKETNHFLEENHIQGKCPSQIRLGLFYNDLLVSVMTFGLKRTAIMGNHKQDNQTYELLRFCNLRGYQVIGGASKLLRYFIKTYRPEIIESFSSNDISNGNLYKKLNFEEDKINNSYWYIDKNWKRYHRSSFTKNAIVRRKWKDSKDGWTEREVMQEHNYLRVQDSGQTKWILKPKY